MTAFSRQRNGPDADCPVVIVGAGPVGSILALTLARHGVDSIVIERSTCATRHPKMDYINARSMELLRRLGLADELREVGVPTDQDFNFFWTQGFDQEPVCEWSSGSVDVLREQMASCNDGSLPREPYQRVIGSRLEDLTRRRCRESELIDLREGWNFVGLSQDDHGVRVAIADRTGCHQQVHGRFVVGCDGTNSAVRKAIEIPVDELGPVSQNVNVYFRSSDPALLRYGRFFLAVVGTGVTLVSRDGADTWTGVFPRVDGKPFQGDPIPELSSRLGIDLKVDSVMSVANWDNRLAVVRGYRLGNVFLAGDSAHQFFPSGGHGANTGIADAADLGWKLAAVINGWAHTSLLDSYEAERRRVALFNREMCFNLMEVWRRFIFLNREKSSRAEMAGYLEHQRFHSNNTGIHLGYRYNGSPIIAEEDGQEPSWHSHRFVPTTWPGGRLPSIRLEHGAELFDLLGPEFTLVDLSGSSAGLPIALEAARLGVPVEHIELADSNVRSVYERDLVLVRPDQHVAWRGHEAPADVTALLGCVAASQRNDTYYGNGTYYSEVRNGS